MADFGQIAIVAAMVVAAYAAVAAILGVRLRATDLVASAYNGVLGVAILMTVASGTLLAAFLTNDFSIRYVAEHSSREMPLSLVAAAFYGGQAGSLLYWGWTLSLFSAIVAYQRRHDADRELMAYVHATLMVVMCFFGLILGFVASPFEKMAVAPANGQGLNPLLYDVQDYGLGIVSADGRLWAEAPGVTLFVGVLSDTIKTGLDRHGPDGFADGDVLIANDPYLTGTHISDTSVYTPIFADGQLVAFAVATAHWADIGGKVPGGWCPDSTDVYQEGICFTHEKLVAGGVPNDALWSVIMNNVRYPTTVRGDLEAKIAACRQGALRVQALCAKHGIERVREAMDLSIERTDVAIRRRIAELPDGTYGAQLVMDHDGVNKADHYTLALQITVAGDRIRVSFDGTSRTVGGPVNIPAMGTRSAVRAALKGFLSPTEPANEGDFKAIEFDIEPGLVVSPQRPAPVDSYGYVCIAVWELTMRALAGIVPTRCVAGGGQLCMPTISRVDPRLGTPFVLADPLDVGNGARLGADAPTMAMLDMASRNVASPREPSTARGL